MPLTNKVTKKSYNANPSLPKAVPFLFPLLTSIHQYTFLSTEWSSLVVCPSGQQIQAKVGKFYNNPKSNEEQRLLLPNT